MAGADPAEGNPTSDDSACTWVDSGTGEEVATLVGKWEPAVFAEYVSIVSEYYNYADIMAERNNHGHLLIYALINTFGASVMNGPDGRPGWLSNAQGKKLMYDTLAEKIRAKEVLIRSAGAVAQIASIDEIDLRAPEGMHDDIADSWALLCGGMTYGSIGESSASGEFVEARDVIDEYDSAEFA